VTEASRGVDDLDRWLRQFFDHEPGPQGQLQPHDDWCVGCGPQNTSGHHMQVRRVGDGVAIDRHVFDSRHVGAPGIAHGGSVATVLDDLFGFLLLVIGEPAVTRELNVEYLAAIRLGQPVRFEAHLHERDGRKLHVLASGHHADTDAVMVRAKALFLCVPTSHFSVSTD